MLELQILPSNLRQKIDKAPIDKIIDFPIVDPFPGDHITINPISSAHGKIKTLLFTLPKDSDAKAQYNFFCVLDEIMQEMPLVEKFIIIFRGYELDLDINFKHKLYRNHKIELLIIKSTSRSDYSDDELSIWAQDHFYPLEFTDNNTNKKSIAWAVGNLSPNYFSALEKLILLKKEENQDTSSTLDRVELKTTGLPFQGGNILVGDGFILVGQNDYHKDYKKWFGLTPIFVKTSIPPSTEEKYISKDLFENEFPLDHKNPYQPIFHIDMFLTLAGFNETRTTYNIVVGRPELGVENIKNLDADFYTFLNKWLTQMQASICCCIEQLKLDFKKALDLDLAIISVPLVLSYTDIVDISQRKRKWFWASYNNSLVENTKATDCPKASKKVWLPSYGSSLSNFENEPMRFDLREGISKNLQKDFISIKYGNWTNLECYDKQSEYIWKSLGFEVCLLQQSYIPFACQYGALNCFTNCIERQV